MMLELQHKTTCWLDCAYDCYCGICEVPGSNALASLYMNDMQHRNSLHYSWFNTNIKSNTKFVKYNKKCDIILFGANTRVFISNLRWMSVYVHHDSNEYKIEIDHNKTEMLQKTFVDQRFEQYRYVIFLVWYKTKFKVQIFPFYTYTATYDT